jgi:hypothetical protein
MANLFIVHYPGAPIRVPDRGKVTVGRANNNTIIIAEPRVSRLHAQIEWRESLKNFVLVDLGSSNGTYLNNEKVSSLVEIPLNDRDKVRIASSVLTLRFVDNQAVIDGEFITLRQRIHCQVTEVVKLADLHKARQSAISGDLAHLCPIELFQMLETGQKTGMLTLKTPIGEGSFIISKGKIIKARFKELQGEYAVYETLKCSGGPFEFLPQDTISEKPQITLATTTLLMEGCRLMDEAIAMARQPDLS